MGKDKTTQKTDQQTVTTPSFIPQFAGMEEAEIKDLFGISQAGVAGQTQLAQNLPNLINALLTGQQLPGAYGNLYQGISDEMTGDIAKESIRDLPAYYQQAGILDSGVAPAISARVAGESRLNSAQFNINNLLNLLGLGTQGANIAQTGFQNQTATLGERLAGLRPITQQGTGYQKTTAMNPFWKSFQQSAGQTLGSPSFQTGPFTF